MRRRGFAALALLLAAPAWAQDRLVPLMGKRLIGPGGEELGRVVDIIADATGQPVAAVVDVGGFMGIGSRRVALAWALLRWKPEATFVRLSIDVAPDVVIGAPEFRREDPTTIFDPSRPK
jgi:hypothetical protein